MNLTKLCGTIMIAAATLTTTSSDAVAQHGRYGHRGARYCVPPRARVAYCPPAPMVRRCGPARVGCAPAPHGYGYRSRVVYRPATTTVVHHYYGPGYMY